MGRKGGHRSKRQRTDNNRDKAKPDGEKQAAYSDVVQENELMERFYKELTAMSEEEWEAYRAAIRRRLPTTFRITGTRKHAKCVQQVLETQYFPKLEALEIDGDEYDKPQPMPWYPEGMAYHCEFGRQLVRRSPQLASFHKFLVNESERGNISRQEAVSMIPPLLLDVQPGHCVLDMCAAPGSKTAQIIEMLQQDEAQSVAEGLVVANDADSKRSYMLVHQAKRLHSPCFLVTNDDATRFPGLRRGEDEPLQFDRVLCDVPCSGDGTVRKNPLIWKAWTPYLGPSQHVLQTRILTRGLQLLKVGGTLVYSTCSMHPAENEAVVADALRRFSGQVELVDVREQLPGLERKRGLSEWKLMGKVEKDWKWFARYEDVPTTLHARLKDTMFARDDCAEMGLDKCVRVYPHQQDTGAFFIAVLRKTAPITRAEQQAAEPEPKSFKSKKRNTYQSEEPFVFFNNDEVMKELEEYYGLRADFPREQLITRTETGKVRQIYLVSKEAATLLRHNPALKIVNTGVRAFTRTDGAGVGCQFRPAQEALDALAPYFAKRMFPASFDDAVTLLKKEHLDADSLSAGLQSAIGDNGPGPAVLVYEPQGDEGMSRSTVRMCAWIGKRGVRLLVTKEDAFSILLRLAGPEAAEQAFAERQQRSVAAAQARAASKDAAAAAGGEAEVGVDVEVAGEREEGEEEESEAAAPAKRPAESEEDDVTYADAVSETNDQ